ncbi:aspartyl-phosphate phosphatase Spo0E family protein [Anaerobacillus isosaccharinicus]|uniref:Aspartyl-phosphate phosphatase Spo0E family protein n=1 Tax=Anaerobacillus isosaccharinicus TaxID=1532552 RepID=A0A1S2MDR8_9BACI|nr:aspartyl-phosphate phosphatase Spo0E family protein [Anaerobacillus isosaccharinicus]MBA5586686.1 aspartyl-phosphate phosphatase Spo0E family protein [Anaerobacillus isosaccharinicus]QOY35084.1 aspartyl-phosphate phosphatase Spo0E family protein [Anaerobacillus isosaccharinicus]
MSGNFSRKTNLLNSIERLRAELIQSGIEKGLTHPSTIDLSQQLDILLNEYKEMMTTVDYSLNT